MPHSQLVDDERDGVCLYIAYDCVWAVGGKLSRISTQHMWCPIKYMSSVIHCLRTTTLHEDGYIYVIVIVKFDDEFCGQTSFGIEIIVFRMESNECRNGIEMRLCLAHMRLRITHAVNHSEHKWFAPFPSPLSTESLRMKIEYLMRKNCRGIVPQITAPNVGWVSNVITSNLLSYNSPSLSLFLYANRNWVVHHNCSAKRHFSSSNKIPRTIFSLWRAPVTPMTLVRIWNHWTCPLVWRHQENWIPYPPSSTAIETNPRADLNVDYARVLLAQQKKAMANDADDDGICLRIFIVCRT